MHIDLTIALRFDKHDINFSCIEHASLQHSWSLIPFHFWILHYIYIFFAV